VDWRGKEGRLRVEAFEGAVFGEAEARAGSLKGRPGESGDPDGEGAQVREGRERGEQQGDPIQQRPSGMCEVTLSLVVCGEQINHYPARRGRA